MTTLAQQILSESKKVMPGSIWQIDWDGNSIVYVNSVDKGQANVTRLNRPFKGSDQPVRPEDKITMPIKDLESEGVQVEYDPKTGTWVK